MRGSWWVLLGMLPGLARAQPAPRPTTLLQDDLASGRRTKIDAPTDNLDAQLDAALGGPQGFSTLELEKIEDRLKVALKRERPRATPRLVLFLYPGRISAERLRSLRDISVDMELVMDPCERSVCREAVGKHIELVGRALGAQQLTGPGWRVTFQTVTLKTQTQMHDAQLMIYKVPIKECLSAALRPGGGVQWLASQDRAEQEYEPLVVRAIARRAAERRVHLDGAPLVVRSASQVDVVLKVRGDRARAQEQVLQALGAAAAGLRDNPKTPAETHLEVALDSDLRGTGLRRFRAPGSAVGLWLDGRLSGGALLSSYVEEVKKQPGAARMSFDDAEASGHGGGGEAGEPNDDEVIALLAQSFGALGACAKAELARGKGFRGVTVTFRWTPDGHAQGVQPKEPALRGGPLAACLKQAVESLRLPRFSGGARTIEYPIRVK